MASTAPSDVVHFEKRLQERLQAILDAMPVAISWARLDNQHIEFVNRKFTAMFGYVLGDHPTVTNWIESTYVNPEHVKRAGDMWYKHFGGASTEPFEIPQVEVDVLCKDQTIKTTLLGGVIVPEAGWALATFVDITERKEAENRVQKLALEDPLTGLPNRRAFTDTLKGSIARAARQNSRTALLIIDLDGFKPLNDTLGHDRGDIVLQTVAQRLTQGIRAGDLVARIGGDEFAAIVDGIVDSRVAEDVATRLIAGIRKPITLNGNEVELDSSIGISVYPTDSSDEQTLYRNADLALYRAKNSGRGRWSR
ncbi:MAG: GGDEF domain-containing protein [Gammaproteobacteria bacterium]|nr:GGDEF domain-containing protein [Gammaproteobacteria bacterium]